MIVGPGRSVRMGDVDDAESVRTWADVGFYVIVVKARQDRRRNGEIRMVA